ncbi:MAG: chloramphenicol acetyltransferase CAT [Firmicutes bacterium]|nr:chloramphenicol acetyltransferase CAT [Bacillota bacterium]
MKRELKFAPIDLGTWRRGEIFYYFSKMAPTGYSLTVKLDVTKMKDVLDEHDLKFFPAYLWIVTKRLNQQEEFRIAVKDEQIGVYDHLTPLYASFHEDDKTFSLMWTEYDDDFRTFYDAYVRNQEEYGDNHGVLAQTGMVPPPNAYTISAVPWIPFEHFAVHSYENKSYFFPSVEAGKFKWENHRLMMPLSLTCHHATTDGYHIKLFLEQLQDEMNRFEQYLD